ncbi:hypothetical protein BDW68DRAFT_116691 [Aspergillus falconensis]
MMILRRSLVRLSRCALRRGGESRGKSNQPVISLTHFTGSDGNKRTADNESRILVSQEAMLREVVHNLLGFLIGVNVVLLATGW